MSETKVINVSPLFRVLAGFISIGSIWALLQKPAFYLEDWYFLLCWTTMTPLFLTCALTGKIPSYLIQLMDDEMFAIWKDARPLFRKFNATSVGFGAVVIFLILFVIYRDL